MLVVKSQLVNFNEVGDERDAALAFASCEIA